MPDGRNVVFGTQNTQGMLSEGMIGFWDVTTAAYRPGPRGAAHLGLDFLPDGGIVTSDVDGLARIWRPEPASPGPATWWRRSGRPTRSPSTPGRWPSGPMTRGS